MVKLRELKLPLLPHPLYSPDLASNDFCLFPNVKEWLPEKRFESKEDVITKTEACFEELPKSS